MQTFVLIFSKNFSTRETARDSGAQRKFPMIIRRAAQTLKTGAFDAPMEVKF
ncbi:MAG: hypothetical protein IKN72_09185 [Clostridia bacterium]|nr:hypothetical protein [Clostridia bacterium]